MSFTESFESQFDGFEEVPLLAVVSESSSDTLGDHDVEAESLSRWLPEEPTLGEKLYGCFAQVWIICIAFVSRVIRVRIPYASKLLWFILELLHTVGVTVEKWLRALRAWWNPTYPVFATGSKSPVPQGTWYLVRPFLWVIFRLRTMFWSDPGTLSMSIASARVLPSNFRKPFLAHFIPTFRRMPKHHSHRQAAGERSGINTSMVDAVKAVGYLPYIISPGAELIGDEEALRLFHSLKDCNKEYRCDPVTNGHAFVLTDCDYYADMNELLKAFRPIVLYTFAPVSAGGAVHDATFFFVNDEVKYLIAGGSSYQHKLWDYAGADGHVAVVSHDKSLLVYDLEIREVGEDGGRRVIVISPSACIRYPYWTASFAPKPLLRLDPTVNGIALIRTTVNDTDCVSLARNGIAESVTFPTSLLYVCHSRWTAASKPERSMITRVLLNQKSWFEAQGSAELATTLLCEAFGDMDSFLSLAGRWMAPTSRIPIEEPTPRGARHYQATEGLVFEDGGKYAREIHKPLVTEPAVFPVTSVNNDKACIQDRLTKVRNDKVPAPKYDHYWAEFNKFLVPDDLVGTLAPLSIGEVDELQSLPAQRARSAREWPSLGLPTRMFISSFQKKESYGKAGAPRNISTVPTAHTLSLSSFTLAFKKSFLKPCPWYAPAKTPKEIAERIQDIARRGDAVHCKDLSRQDGTISGYLNDKYRDAMVRAFAPEYRPELIRLLDAERGANGATSQGVPYKSGQSRKSGSPTTTDGNTHCSGGVSYSAYRLLGLSPREAWEALGLYGGDDSIDEEGEGTEAAHHEAYSEHGLILKFCTTKRRGEPVDFYGRYFVDPWTTLDSFADPWRTIAKLGSTVAQGDLLSVAINKARGYVSTDARTPVIGVWARKLTSFGAGSDLLMTKEERFKLSQAWPQVDAAAIRAAFLHVSELDCEVVERMEASIAACECLEDFDHIEPLDNAHLVKHDPAYVIEGEFFAPPGPNKREAQTNVRQEQVEEGATPRPKPRTPAPVRGQHDHAGLEGSNNARRQRNDLARKPPPRQEPRDNRNGDDGHPNRRPVRRGGNGTQAVDRKLGAPNGQFMAREDRQSVRSLEADQVQDRLPAASDDRKRGSSGPLVRSGSGRTRPDHVRDGKRERGSGGRTGVRTPVSVHNAGPAQQDPQLPDAQRKHAGVDGSGVSRAGDGDLDTGAHNGDSSSDSRVHLAGVRSGSVGGVQHLDLKKNRRKPRSKKGKEPAPL